MESEGLGVWQGLRDRKKNRLEEAVLLQLWRRAPGVEHVGHAGGIWPGAQGEGPRDGRVNMPSSRRSGWMLSSAKASRVLPALCCTGSGGGKLNMLEPEGLDSGWFSGGHFLGAGSTPSWRWWWWWCRRLLVLNEKCRKAPFRQPNMHVSDLRHLSSAER